MTKQIEILLVEDTPSDIRLTEEALKRSDLTYQLKVVNDGVEAMEHLEAAKKTGLPDIILLDLNMPRKNGHEVLEEIKHDEELRRIPVVVLTVSQRDEDVMEALQSKMNYYIAKPISSNSISVLIKAIHSLESSDSAAKYDETQEQNHIRLVLAGNPHSSQMVLTRLSQDSSDRVRARVAENANAPLTVLKQLASDESSEVRLSLAENPNVSEELLKRLASDQDEDVRLALAGNAKVPGEILMLLADDENVFVAQEASKTLSRLSKV